MEFESHQRVKKLSILKVTQRKAIINTRADDIPSFLSKKCDFRKRVGCNFYFYARNIFKTNIKQQNISIHSEVFQSVAVLIIFRKVAESFCARVRVPANLPGLQTPLKIFYYNFSKNSKAIII